MEQNYLVWKLHTIQRLQKGGEGLIEFQHFKFLRVIFNEARKVTLKYVV